MQTTVNQTELARELGVTTRRARQLEELGVIVPHWQGGYELPKNFTRYSIFVRRDAADKATLEDEIVQAVKDAERLFAEADPHGPGFEAKVRRASDAVTLLDEAMKLRNSMTTESQRGLLDSFREMLIGHAQGALLALVTDFLEHKATTANADV